MLQAARTKVSPIGAQAKRAYSSEMANALVQVSQNACLPPSLSVMDDDDDDNDNR